MRSSIHQSPAERSLCSAKDHGSLRSAVPGTWTFKATRKGNQPLATCDGGDLRKGRTLSCTVLTLDRRCRLQYWLPPPAWSLCFLFGAGLAASHLSNFEATRKPPWAFFEVLSCADRHTARSRTQTRRQSNNFPYVVHFTMAQA